ncbi:winged helix-turn-helix domain-containing protein [bacterium]|nr:winged helix-turn-helix domain-containing protein [bacterium]
MQILKQLNKEIEKYELIVLYGPSGCGKTYHLQSWKLFTEYRYVDLSKKDLLLDLESEQKSLILDHVSKVWLEENIESLLQCSQKVILLSNEALYSILTTRVRFKVLHCFELQSAHEICEFSLQESYLEKMDQDLCHSLLIRFHGNQRRIVQFFEYIDSFNLACNRKSIDLFMDYMGIEIHRMQEKAEDTSLLRSISMLYPFTSVQRFPKYQSQINALLDQGFLYVHDHCLRLKFELLPMKEEQDDLSLFIEDFCQVLVDSSEYYLTDFLNLYSLCLGQDNFSKLFTLWQDLYQEVLLDRGSLSCFFRAFSRHGSKIKILPLIHLELYLIIAYHSESEDFLSYEGSKQSVSLKNILEKLDCKSTEGLYELIHESWFPTNISNYLYFELLDLLIEEGSIAKSRELLKSLISQEGQKLAFNKNKEEFFHAKLNRIEGRVSHSKNQLEKVFQSFVESNFVYESYDTLVQIAYCQLYLLNFETLDQVISDLQNNYQGLKHKKTYFEYRLMAYKKVFQYQFSAARNLISEAYFDFSFEIKSQQESLFFSELLLFELMAKNQEKIESFLFRMGLDDSKKQTNITHFLTGLYLYSIADFRGALDHLKQCNFIESNVGIYQTKLLISFFIGLCCDKLDYPNQFLEERKNIFKELSFEAQVFYSKCLESFELGVSGEALQYYSENGQSLLALRSSKRKNLTNSNYDLVMDLQQNRFLLKGQYLDFTKSPRVLNLLVLFMIHQKKALSSHEMVCLLWQKNICHESDLNSFRVNLMRLRKILNDEEKSMVTSKKEGRTHSYQLNSNLKTLLICNQSTIDYFALELK